MDAFADEFCIAGADLLAHFAGREFRHPPLPKATPERLASARRVLTGEFECVGEIYRLPAGFSWTRSPSRDKEWQIEQHKFYFAVDLIAAWRAEGDARYLRRWVELLGAWLDEMGTGFISASDAQVEAKRVEHWVTSILLLQGTDWARHVPAAFLARLLARIAEETHYIAANLRPSRNHRTFQLYTVFMVGVLFPEFRHSAYWTETGAHLLTANLLTDFGPDGVHVELSTHYHQITLETALAFVELARVNGIALDAALLARLRLALEFSLRITWPDGGMPLINDSDAGDNLGLIARGARLFDDPELLWASSGGLAGAPPASPGHHFADCGYFTLSDTWGSDAVSYLRRQHVFFDAARLGEGSHSHYDALSFCYFAGGAPLVIDPGRYTYNADPGEEGLDWRREFKSTRYHNTVTIDDLDQTRYLSKSKTPPRGVERYNRSVHVAKHGPDAQICELQQALGGMSDWIWSTVRSHEYAALHTRVFVFMARQYLFVFDQVLMQDDAEHECTLRFHLDARWQRRVRIEEGEDELVLQAPEWQIRSARFAGSAAELGHGWVSQRYGVKERAPVLAVRRRGSRSVCFASVVAHTAAVPAGLAIRRLRVLESGDQALVFRVEGECGGRPFVDRYVVHPDAAGLYSDRHIDYRGRFLAYRCDGDDRFSFLCAAEPQLLVLNHVPAIKRSSRGHVEWLALRGAAPDETRTTRNGWGLQ